MAYEWAGNSALRRVGDDNVEPGETFEPTEAELESFGSQINEETIDVEGGVVEEDNPEGSDGEDTNAESETDGSDADEGEEPDYAAMDYQELRELAVDADTDEINGRSSKDEIVAYFTDDE